MREIKFRAWNIEKKKMVSWGEIVRNKEWLQSIMGNEFYATNPPRYLWERMQFTGLHDKNGKEIYEGDILKWTSSKPFSFGQIRKVKVTYTEARYWCNTWDNKWGIYLGELLVEQRCEVVGNIFENEFLLHENENV